MTPEYIRSRIHYDPLTGIFTWITHRQKRFCGKQLGHLQRNGYVRVWIRGKTFYLHRLAWLYMTGEWPPDLTDHIDGDKANNRISNLRLATPSQNTANSRSYGKNLKGARRDHSSRNWLAQITINGHQRHLGSFPTEEEAHAAYCRAARELFGEFARVA